MKDLKTGDVFQISPGLKCFHNQNGSVMEIKAPVIAVVETSREIEPMEITGADGHFERCYIIKARVLTTDGLYHPEGALLTIAQSGDFRPEFLLPEGDAKVLRRMNKTFLAPEGV